MLAQRRRCCANIKPEQGVCMMLGSWLYDTSESQFTVFLGT